MNVFPIMAYMLSFRIPLSPQNNENLNMNSGCVEEFSEIMRASKKQGKCDCYGEGLLDGYKLFETCVSSSLQNYKNKSF